MSLRIAINDLGQPGTNAHLTRHDTAHGRFSADVGRMLDTACALMAAS